MPVTLTNNSPFPIRLHPYLSVAQLCLLSLTSTPERLYGDEGVGSKYSDDEGGPSRYWLDHTIETLRKNLNMRNSSPKAEAFLEDYAQELDDPTRERFLRVLARAGYIGDGADFANAFVSSERKRVPLTSSVGIVGTTALSLAIRFLPSAFGLGSVGWAIAIPASLGVAAVFYWVYRRQFGTTMSPSELRKLVAEVRKK